MGDTSKSEREAIISTPDGFSVSVSTSGESEDCVQLQVAGGEIVLLPVEEFCIAADYVRRQI